MIDSHPQTAHTKKLRKHEPKPVIAWYTRNERSGTMGKKWYCYGCNFMMVFVKDPNTKVTDKDNV